VDKRLAFESSVEVDPFYCETGLLLSIDSCDSKSFLLTHILSIDLVRHDLLYERPQRDHFALTVVVIHDCLDPMALSVLIPCSCPIETLLFSCLFHPLVCHETVSNACEMILESDFRLRQLN